MSAKRVQAFPVSALVLYLGLSGCATSGPLPAGTGSNDVVGVRVAGYWQDSMDTDYFVGFEGSRMTVSRAGRLRSVSQVLEVTPSRLLLCQAGWTRAEELSWDPAGFLVLKDARTGEMRKLRRVLVKPSSLAVKGMALPQPMPVPPEQVASIQRELWQHAFGGGSGAGGQAVDLAPESLLPWRAPESRQVDDFSVADLARASGWARDLDYLRNLVAQVGWIDAERFGYATANAAFFLVQHSWEVPLMMAALPWIEKDVVAGRTEGEDYALLFDRIQLATGEKQRYGTQVGIDLSNSAFVFPVEDSARVDERRRELGLMPIAEYVSLVARFNKAFAPERVVFLDGCASDASSPQVGPPSVP